MGDAIRASAPKSHRGGTSSSLRGTPTKSERDVAAKLESKEAAGAPCQGPLDFSAIKVPAKRCGDVPRPRAFVERLDAFMLSKRSKRNPASSGQAQAS